jgi:hypothetical protein
MNPSLPPRPDPAEHGRFRTRQLQLVAVCLAFAIVSVLLRVVYARRLETTSLLFIGIPTLLSVLLALTPRPRSAMGMVMKGITLGLLMSAILFGEGIVCIVMAAPLCYVVGALVALAVQRFNRRQALSIALTPLALMSLEGTSDRLSFDRDETVAARRIVAASAADVERVLAGPMRFRTDLPPFLGIGFPRPVQGRGQGLNVGDLRIVGFSGGEGRPPGDLILRVSERGPGRVAFRAEGDTSHIPHWLSWRGADVTWRQVDERHTEVVWVLRYRRGLDPAWYFGPIERYAVRLAAGYLVDNLATP